jgi:hypothetical protein
VGEALALDAAWLFAAFLLLLVLAASVIAARRFLLERGGATVECGLRKGRGSWRLGVASYRLDELCWFGVFGIPVRPDECFSRRDLAVVSRRPPTEEEESILGPGRIVVQCQLGVSSEPGEPGGLGELGGLGESGVPGGLGESGVPGDPGASSPAGSASASGEGGGANPGGADRAVELALAESALTGLLAWLEAAPPGSHLGLVL